MLVSFSKKPKIKTRRSWKPCNIYWIRLSRNEYKVLDYNSGHIVISRDVLFNEDDNISIDISNNEIHSSDAISTYFDYISSSTTEALEGDYSAETLNANIPNVSSLDPITPAPPIHGPVVTEIPIDSDHDNKVHRST